FQQALDARLDAAAYGVAIAEIIYEVSAGQVALLDIKDRPQELFRFSAQAWEPAIGPLRFLRDASLQAGELVPEEKFLVLSHRPRTGNRRGRPLLRSVFWPSWFKRQTIRFWLRFGEKGPGTAAVKYPTGATQDQRDEALKAAEAFVESVAVAVPENMGLITELLTSARAQNPAVYEKLVERMELAITRRILGQTLTTRGSEQGAGSFALGQVHQDVFHMKTVELARMLEMLVNDNLVKRLALWNFGPAAPLPKWLINKESEDDLAQRSAIDARLQSMGLDFAESYARKKYGVPEIKAGDVVLEPRQIAAAAGGSPFAFPPQQGFAEPGRLGRRPEEVRRAQEDIRRLMQQLRQEALGQYRARVLELGRDALGNRGTG
ncbi:MAG: phage portal protein family protein, partial [Terriglobales bacterium]